MTKKKTPDDNDRYVWVYKLKTEIHRTEFGGISSTRVGEDLYLNGVTLTDPGIYPISMWRTRPKSRPYWSGSELPGEYVRVRLNLTLAPLPKRKPRPKTVTTRKIIAVGQIFEINFDGNDTQCWVTLHDGCAPTTAFALNKYTVLDLAFAWTNVGPFELVEVIKRTGTRQHVTYEILMAGQSDAVG